MSDEARVRFTLRLPKDLSDKVTEQAKANNRSKSAQIIHYIELAIKAHPTITEDYVSEFLEDVKLAFAKEGVKWKD